MSETAKAAEARQELLNVFGLRSHCLLCSYSLSDGRSLKTSMPGTSQKATDLSVR